MSAARPQFSIDDAFELSLEDAGPGAEPSGVARFGPLHFERRARFEVADEDKQSRLRYQNLENDEDGAQASPEPDGGVSTRDSGRTSIRSSQWSFSTISSGTQRSYNTCCSWTQHPLIQKNRRVVLASFLLLLLGLGVSSAIFFVPGFLLLVPGGATGASSSSTCHTSRSDCGAAWAPPVHGGAPGTRALFRSPHLKGRGSPGPSKPWPLGSLLRKFGACRPGPGKAAPPALCLNLFSGPAAARSVISC
ncbi:transmembrane protein 134 isoform X2 [Callithrix jacchus]|uniref:transmembrane protein 134 isoform X2 n=1 Tax=Callithrix jacchus TaxID=9483 RepID=UPI0004F085B2|nr:transmembrane protein 134 isoform X2 [Callithrix jacchus]